jgi:hypothetical protein
MGSPSGEPEPLETRAPRPSSDPDGHASAAPTILVVDGDDGLSYLLERYAQRGGFGFRRVRASSPAAAGDGPLSLWLPSVERLEAVSPRETGLVGDDTPVIVCSSPEEESRAHGLGADYCVMHPLRYPDFLGALRAVGFGGPADLAEVPRATDTGASGGAGGASPRHH